MLDMISLGEPSEPVKQVKTMTRVYNAALLDLVPTSQPISYGWKSPKAESTDRKHGLFLSLFYGELYGTPGILPHKLENT